MFEKLNQPLASRRSYLMRLIHSILMGLLFITVAEVIGMIGYHYLEQISWIDSFVNASMILSSMGPLQQLHTIGGKLFAGFYALFCGLVFIFIIGVIFAPVVHRFIHKIHVDEDSKSK